MVLRESLCQGHLHLTSLPGRFQPQRSRRDSVPSAQVVSAWQTKDWTSCPPGSQGEGEAAKSLRLFCPLHKLEAFVCRVAFCFVFDMLLSLSVKELVPQMSWGLEGPVPLGPRVSRRAAPLRSLFSSSMNSGGLDSVAPLHSIQVPELEGKGWCPEFHPQCHTFVRDKIPLLDTVTQLAPSEE